MFSRLKNLFPQPVPRQPLPWSSLSLEAWRSVAPRTEYSKRLLREPMFASLLSVLQNSMPMPVKSSSKFDAGVVQGYMLCLNNIVLSAEPGIKPQIEVEPTYDRPVEDLIETEQS